MTKHPDRESTVEELTRRVRELREQIGEHEPLATALEKVWAAIDGYLGELRKVSTALAGAEADETPLLAQWTSQLFLLDSAFALVDERLLSQASARNRIATYLESASAELKGGKAKGDKLVVSVESLMADLVGHLPGGDAELIRLLDVLTKRVRANKESLAHLERALVDFDKRARMLFGAGDAK
jgi:hypothetical protein